MGEERENESAEQPLPGRAAVVALDLCARALDQPVVADAGGARRHAGEAAEAAVEVLDHLFREDAGSLQPCLHEDDAPAW